MNELLAQFVAEARDLLQEAGEDLLALERAPDNQEAINRLFRSVHTLKGSSGLFDVQPLTQLLHAGEDIFQAVREHSLLLTPEMADLTLKTLDQVGRWIEHLDRHEALPGDAAPIARELVAELRGSFNKGPIEALVNPFAPKANASSPAVSLGRWFGKEMIANAAIAAREESISLVSYLPEEGCFFKGEDPLHLAMQIPQLQALGIEERLPWPALYDLNPFSCNLGFHALSTADRPELETLFRCVPDQVTITEITASALADSLSEVASGIVLPAVVEALLREQIDLLEFDAPLEEFAGRVSSAARVAANALCFAGYSEDAAILETAQAESLGAGWTAPLRNAIADLLRPGVDSANNVPEQAMSGQAVQSGPGDTTERAGPKTLRVDQQKVDALMNLIGELVVAKNSLPFLARRAEQQFGSRELSHEIKDQYGVIDRIAQELQGAVMAIRMMPVGQVFQRFPRLVRDLARKLGKQVDLVIEGEDTEADKNVIESLFDPLLHMVRNSLDHGVESPEKRLAFGKPSTARVKLLARRDGDQVVIEVVDDGRGIDPDAIKRKAYERGLIDEMRLATITDDEATMLVFAAGFSTAETISDVSGRGVGMDVVRNAVEKAGGRIAMTSVKGAGTTVRIDLPLSMAVSRVMTVALGNNLFGVPMDLIEGIVKVLRSDIVRIKECEAFVLRDRVVPLVRLTQLLDLPGEPAAGEEIAVLVVRVNGQTIGLGISAFGEGMEVILKPLEGMLAKIAGYAGTALLGDGRVLLVLDLKELIQ
ncbi:chemotaxis protein CheA [Rhodopseudomonas sp. P2A-2r]|uniref:chemotaxis protein CheA n=1 Tax=unclassified Rhodopseudomonas TaxID=2638247 RepID=UPI0022340C97|nr:chemotaxis protein CheA [Rhodopseudomonas sp. P2A-2r]UZE49015.1 chemotaxis protein CheA [Rhodopseudomonas sp. P2A-2r]